MKEIHKWQWMVLMASFIQLISPGVVTLLGFSVNSPNSDPQITPAGYAFVVWGVITILSFAYGLFQVFPNRTNKQLHSNLSRGLTGVYLLFVFWLIAAILKWLTVTVIIFLIMFVLLTLLFEKIIQERHRLTRIEKIILFGQIAIYTGWTTIAIFANSASAIKYYGLTDTGVLGILWQSVILILALVNGKYWLKKFDRNVIYGLTLIWALSGVFFGLLRYSDNLPLRIITLFGIILVGLHLLIPDIIQKVRLKGNH